MRKGILVEIFGDILRNFMHDIVNLIAERDFIAS